MAQVVQTLEQQMYLSRLIGYDYTIQYHLGKLNLVADALSKIPKTPPGTLLMLFMLYFTFLLELKCELSVHPEFIAFQQDIQTNPAAYLDCIITEDLILQKGHIWLPNGFNFINSLLEEFHTTPTGGNMGIKITLARLGEIFTWQNIREDVRLFIATCTYYQHTKYEASKPIGLLCPWHVP